VFRHTRGRTGGSGYSKALSLTGGHGRQQQFIFQQPQQPYQHQTAPGPSPTAQYGPAGYGPPVAQQTKIPMTFVNQTIASRNAAATSGNGHGNGNGPANGNGNGNGSAHANAKGGQRILLPKGL
jgi:hypothetical protein